MDCKYTSTVLAAGDAIDCRCLILATEFYQLSQKESLEIADEITKWAEDLLGKAFVTKTLAGGKWVGKDKRLWGLMDALTAQKGWSYGFEGMAISPVVHSIKTYNSYFQNIRRGKYRSERIYPGVSVDYREFWNDLFAEIPDNTTIKQNILRIFRETGKSLVSIYDLPDVQATLGFTPYQRMPNSYYGTFSIHISSFCLAGSLADMSDSFVSFAKQLSEKYVKLNARVMLQPNIGPLCNPYMYLFTSLQQTDGSHVAHNCAKNEWYSTYYIPGVEWFNIISPLAQMHLSEPISAPSSIAAKRLSGGGLAVCSAKEIIDYDIPDALQIKELIYPTLYPGMRSISFRTLFQDEIPKSTMSVFPRSDWAIIPVLDNEIDVAYRNVVFSKVI